MGIEVQTNIRMLRFCLRRGKHWKRGLNTDKEQEMELLRDV